MPFPALPLKNMSDRHRGLTPHLALAWLEAARVCLDRHHTPPQEFALQDDTKGSTAVVEWDVTDQRTKDAWNNKDDATRDGAYICAIAAGELLRGFVAISRAETHTGADYYVAPKGSPADDLEESYRLEVSGTDGDKAEVQRRLIVKVDQVLKGKGSFPALAAVVGFRVKEITLRTVEQTS